MYSSDVSTVSTMRTYSATDNAQRRQGKAAMVDIISKPTMQVSLLAGIIEQATNYRCRILEPSEVTPNSNDQITQIIMWDCGTFPAEELWETLCEHSKTSRCLFSLFNLPAGHENEYQALELGARGVFFTKDNINLFQQGIEAMVNGELWFPRPTLSRYLLASRKNVRPLPPQAKTLTKREEQILAMVAQGASNKAIAARFTISESTVKTHLHNIFKKIDVPNRTQAALWATHNL